MVAPLVKASCFVRIADSIKKIVLASASSRRKELLEKIGLKFEVEPSNHVEDSSLRLKPHQLARSLSRGKALAVAANHTNAIVIAADTFIVFRRGIVGKPKTEAEAREMLARLSGKSHLVITGFTIVDTGVSKVMSKSVETKVYMRKLTSTEIDAYIKSKEPLDKAGAYSIRGLGSVGHTFNCMYHSRYCAWNSPLSLLVDRLTKLSHFAFIAKNGYNEVTNQAGLL